MGRYLIFPEDIWDAAEQILKDFPHEMNDEITYAVATAAYSERIRCSNIAGLYSGSLMDYPSEEAKEYYECGAIDASVSISNLINKGIP